MNQPTFAMLCCAHGAESSVKESMAQDGWRLAFSRPGFVTAKHDNARELPSGIFIRTAARSIGQARNTVCQTQIDSLVATLKEKTPNQVFDQLHVWPKDRAPIGRFGFEPGLDEVSLAVADRLYHAIKETFLRCDAPNRIAQPGERVLDVVLVEPAHWFFGTHTADTWPTRWPGAVQPIAPEHPPISRAYYKAAEAITWSGFDIQPGDLAVEVGSAPGGACGRLLEMGCRVIGIDPAEMDPRIANHPKFRHLRARAGDLPRKEFRGAKWLLVDSNVKPNQTLSTVTSIVTHSHSSIEGLLLTMKLGTYDAVDRMDAWIARVNKWNPQSIQIRQLARNKCEVCFAVQF